MLESQANPVVSTASSAEAVLGWLCFLVLLGLALALIPLAAAAIRRALPAAARRPVPVEPIAFGHSPRVQGSPRQPVRMHRTLLAAAVLALPALLLLLGAPAFPGLGVAALEGALALALPCLLVTLHARRRSPRP